MRGERLKTSHFLCTTSVWSGWLAKPGIRRQQALARVLGRKGPVSSALSLHWSRELDFCFADSLPTLLRFNFEVQFTATSSLVRKVLAHLPPAEKLLYSKLVF